MSNDSDNIFQLPDIAKANAEFDAKYPHLLHAAHLRSAWNEGRLCMKGKLTDKKLDKYEKAGWYSAEYREARKDAWIRKRATQNKREGNFDVADDGRLIYRP